MKNKNFKKRVLHSLLFYNILFVFVTVVFCSAIPKLLVYPPDSINTEFERNIDDGYRYNDQCAVIITMAMLASNVVFLWELRKIHGWEKYREEIPEAEEEKKKLENIKKNCIKIPSRLYLLHAFVPPVVTAIGLMITRYEIDFNDEYFRGSVNDIYHNRTVDLCFF